MKPLALAALAALAAAPLVPAARSIQPEPATQSPPAAPAPVVHEDPFGFPTPSDGILISSPVSDQAATLFHMVQAYADVTGQSITYSSETGAYLESTPLNIIGALDIPADRVQVTFEALLASNDFLLVPLTRSAPRVLKIVSLNTGGRNTIRNSAVFIDEDHLDAVAEHAAVLCTTTISLPNTDVRQLSNSMRTMITDANTQQMLPAGNTNNMILVGTGTFVAGLAGMLRQIDAAAKVVVPEATVSGGR